MARPAWIPPMLATLVDAVPDGPGWVYETKLDGFRCIASRAGRKLEMMSRNQLSQNGRFPALAKALAELEADDFVVDGEIVAFTGTATSFSALQQGSGSLALCLFDIMWLDGKDLRALPLVERKKILKATFDFRKPLRYSAHSAGDGDALLREACGEGLEGLIAKQADAPYVGGRSRAWLKLKCVNEQEFVIGGWTDPEGARTGFGALLVGYYEGKTFRYAGKVGTGYDVKTLGTLSRTLAALEQDANPFAEKVPGVRTAHWARPELVAQVGFTEWTSAGRLRHPRFIGLRDDKKARDVVRERPRG